MNFLNNNVMKERNKVTKKQILSTLRAQNRTEIFRLYAQIHGEVQRSGLFEFIRENAPSERVRRQAYRIAYLSDKYNRFGERYPGQSSNFWRWNLDNQRQIAMMMIRREFARGFDKYSRIPYFFDGRLWLCNYRYGLADYNGYAFLEVRGNERFCNLLFRVARRHFGLDVWQ